MPLYPQLVRTCCVFIPTQADDPASTTLAATFMSPPMLPTVSGALDCIRADSPTPTSLGKISNSSPRLHAIRSLPYCVPPSRFWRVDNPPYLYLVACLTSSPLAPPLFLLLKLPSLSLPDPAQMFHAATSGPSTLL
ncbi:hypothetical protein AURDEDRAFT_177362 [Auricularia subglabra TFB-10046 SS5]|uniref:Uncharacterized protein n=1 Tax=Auricularia subglabra (strain TFB-10046 / SS5) TaxID=717982 RepID=J0WNX9_AURST|nr:hypothetical protein AURDEDRAFT_177362 [Auricularia subglabra TFB-10046 SS5]